jgi:hypothetical protein
MMRRLAVLGAVLLVAAGCSTGPGPAVVGDPAVAGHTEHSFAPPPPSEPLRDGERFVDLRMASPYLPVPPRGGTDQYRCFLVDPQLTAPTYVTGAQFLPENPDVVHHAILFRIGPDDVAKAKSLDAADDGDGWTCFGGTGIGGGAGGGGANSGGLGSLLGGGWLAAWAPGGRETLASPGTGYQVAAGSQIVMQVHYNLLATGGKAAGTDQSAVRLRVMDGSANLRPLQTTLLPAPIELPCAPGESGPLCDRTAAVQDVGTRFGYTAQLAVTALNYLCNKGKEPTPGTTQHCDQTVRSAGQVQAVAGHMHLLGRSIKVELNPDTPRARTLLDVPVYNFDDQNAHPVTEPVTVAPGDVLRVTCTHDADLRRQLPELKPLAPRYVVWGDGTSDEMCLGIVIWARP